MLSLTTILAGVNAAGTLALNEENLGPVLHQQLVRLLKLSAGTLLTVAEAELEKDLLHLNGTLKVLGKTKVIPVSVVLLDQDGERHGLLHLQLAAGTSFVNTFKYQTGATFVSEHLAAVHFDRDEVGDGPNHALFSSLPDEVSVQPYLTEYFPTAPFTAGELKRGINLPLKVEISGALPTLAQEVFGDAVDAAVATALTPVVGQILLQADGAIALRVATGVAVTNFGSDDFALQPFNLELVAAMSSDAAPLFIVASSLQLRDKRYGFAGTVDPDAKTLRLSPELNGGSPLADWLGGDGGLDQFPDPLLSLIAPDRLSVGVKIDLAAKEVTDFELAYAPAPVELLNGSIGLTPALEIAVARPFGGDQRSVAWQLEGGGNIEQELLVDASMAFPDPSLQLVMTEPVAARYLFKPFFGDVRLPGADDLLLETMTLNFAPETRYFDLTTALVNGDLGFDVGNFRMALTGVGLTAARDAAGSTYTLAASTNIGETPLLLTGSHSLDAGWDLGLESQEAIVIDQWLFEISSGNFELPEGLSDFEVSTLNFAYQTKTKAIALEVSTKNTFTLPLGNGEGIGLEGLKLTLQRDTRTVASLEGTTSFALGSGGDFSFTVKMDYRSAEPALPSNSPTAPAAAAPKANWLLDARSDQPIDIADLIGELGEKFSLSEDDVELPDSVKDLQLTELYFTADTEAKDYHFAGKSTFEVADLDGSVEIGIRVSADDEGNFSTELKGVLLLEEESGDDVHQFNLIFNKSRSRQRADVMLAHYAGELSLRSIVKLLAGDEAAQSIPPWLSPKMDEVMFLLVKKASGYDFLFSLDIDLTGEKNISLSQLEFIGRFIPPGEDELGIKMKILYSDKGATFQETQIYNQVVTGMGYVFLPRHRSLKKGISVETEITAPLLGDDLVLPVTGSAAPEGQETAESKTAWKPVRKKLGPVFIEKAGITMEDGKVKIILDGGMQMGSFEFRLLGFGVKIPMKVDFNPLTDVDFGLDGLELDVRKGDVSISGGFFRQIIPVNGRNYTGYAGQIRASIGPKSLTAFGGYVDIGGTPSFFLYAVALLPLGGVPEFFIDGFAGGFGLNSSLNIPPIEGVRNFIMVKSAFGESSFDEGGQGGGLSQIFEDIPPAIGRHWIALGIKANHYKFIESFILVAVTFGDRFELELLGLARLKMPKGAEKLVRAELAIHAHVIPSEGIIGINARITDGSYVINPMARLSGGFAFYTWFEGEHAGDFVITIGGYNSKFKKPAHYPSVPRLSLSYQVTRNIYIKGSAYFALTPKLLMLGGRLEGTADLGIISAWFVVNADFTMNFQPFQYLIEASITIGATFTLDLLFVTIRKTIQIGADMKIWGPEFGGEATVDLAIVSFTIEFGKKRQAPAPISWETFKTDLLPPEEDLTRINVSKGVVRELKADKFGPDSVRYIVNPSELELVVESNIPAKNLELVYLDKEAEQTVPGWRLGVGPMRVSSDGFHPRLKVVFSKPDDPGETGEYNYKGTRGTVPAALWGGFMDRDINGPRLLGAGANDAPYKGLTLSPEKDKSADFTPLINIKDLLTPVPTALTAPFPDYAPRPAAESMTEHNFKPLHEVLTAPDASLLNELSALDAFAYLPDQGTLTFNTSVDVTEADTTEFEDNPLLCTLGANAAGTLLTATIPA